LRLPAATTRESTNRASPSPAPEPFVLAAHAWAWQHAVTPELLHAPRDQALCRLGGVLAEQARGDQTREILLDLRRRRDRDRHGRHRVGRAGHSFGKDMPFFG